MPVSRRGYFGLLIGAVVTGVLGLSLTDSALAHFQDIPPEAVGRWAGDCRIVVNWTTQRTLRVALTVAPDGTVTGTIGDAVLRHGRLKANRGPIGRMLNLKTDYIITGDLDGPVIKAEDIVRSGVTLPFNLTEGRLDGAVHTSGWKFGGKEKMMLTAWMKLDRVVD